MTVEQSPLEHFLSPSQKEKVQALCRLKEVTGVDDNSILQQALDASKNKCGEYDLTHAVNMVIDEKTKLKKQGEIVKLDLEVEEGAYKASGDVSQEKTDVTDSVIDLTHEATVGVGVGGDGAMGSSDKEDDLQKAIALSLQDQHVGALGGQVTMEEQDISRVLEASLADNKTLCGTKRKRGVGGEIWQDPLNPHDRERSQPDWPVGLKNVGNTCWFSSVIQSLFHLPVFLQLVLEFVPNKDWLSDENISKRQKILFLQELRKLFALMVATERKYVDPSQALEIFKEALDNSTNKQQDVSEFTHKLIEWLEEAYKFASATSTLKLEDFQDHPNPMTNLFYGRSKSEGQNDGHRFSNDTNFGQCPLQVNGFSDIHESLEAAVTHEIESSSDNSMTKSGQEETWVTRLPPVLLFELSRFHFNQQLGVTEKIHNKLNFPEVIYMDRYLESNKEITRCKREEVRRLKDNRSKLHSRLQKYLNYGSGSKRVPLHDVLQYALEFVESNNGPRDKVKCENPNEDGSPCSKISGNVLLKPSPNLDVEMSSPASATSITMDSPSCSPLKTGTPTQQQCIKTQSPSLVMDRDAFGSSPAPRHITESELGVFQTCLRRWRHEVENDVKELQEEVSKADRAIREIYNEGHLQRVPYKLHAVLVHEGQAASGHYWAYVMCPRRLIWLKCNDATITETTWSELQKDSVGGHKNVSAYCLFYVDHRLYSCGTKESLGKDSSVPDVPGSNLLYQCLKDLPEELQEFVQGDNKMFEQEIQVWDSDQARIKKDASTATTTTTFSGVGASSESNFEDSVSMYTKPEENKFIEYNHAMLALQSTVNKIKQIVSIPRLRSSEVHLILEEGIKLESQRINVLNSQGKNLLEEDTRVHHVAIYFLKNKLPGDPFVKRILLEQFSIPSLVDCLPDLGKEIRKCALARLNALKMNEQQLKEYSEWHKRYSLFRRVIDLFVIGVNSFHSEKYKDALPYLFDAYNVNSSLVQSDMEENRGFNKELLAFYRRKCLLNLNDEAVKLFKKEDLDDSQNNTGYIISLMNEFILPAMSCLNGKDIGALENPSNTADSLATCTIRDSWFSMLGSTLSHDKQEKLGIFLNKLMANGSPEIRLRPSVRLRSDDQELEQKYKETMGIIWKTGILTEIKRLKQAEASA